MDEGQMRRRVAESKVARVGTIDKCEGVHLVSIVFVVEATRRTRLRTPVLGPAKRLRNLKRNPSVTLVVDDYDEDWSRLWWVRTRGTGRVIEDGVERDHAHRLLCEKYPQFGGDPGGGPVMAVDIEHLVRMELFGVSGTGRHTMPPGT